MRTSASSFNTRNVSDDSDSLTSWGGHRILRANAFAGEDHVNGVAGFRIRTIGEPIQKHVDAGGMPIAESRHVESGLSCLEIRPADQQIHVLRETHGGLVNSPDPGGDRVAADHGVGDAGRSPVPRSRATNAA